MAISLSPEKENFKNAELGEDVRDSMVSLADKVENEINDAIGRQLLTVDPTLGESGSGADAKVTGEQFGNVYQAIDTINPNYDFEWTLKKNVDTTGAIATNNYTALAAPIYCTQGDIVSRRMQTKDSDGYALFFYVSQFNGDTFISRTNLANPEDQIIIDQNVDNFRISIGRAAASGKIISQNDIDRYFGAQIYRAAITKEELTETNEKIEEIEDTAFMMRGNVIALGYTSFAECSRPGAYVFTTADLSSITDAPAGFNDGGSLRVYINGNTLYQELINVNRRFIRYGFSGAWHSANDFLRVSYTEESGDDDSVAQISVDIPKNTKSDKIRYKMGHCVNTAVNADVWRLMYLYSVTPSGNETVLTRRGEFECALHLNGRSDFSGGVVHGDEKDQNVAFFGDNVKLNAANTSGFYREFRIVRNSILYDPQDNTTKIAEHGVEYIFNPDGLTINQSIKWLVSEDLTNCYLAMLPILKAFSTYRYDDTNFKIVNNNESGYSYKINQAKSVTEYASSVVSTIEIKNYPSGLSGGDCALITDNGGLDYNKVYFPVCASGKTQIGELWKSITIYRIH